MDVVLYVNSSNFASEFLMSTRSPNSESPILPRNVMDWVQPLHFDWQAKARATGEAVRSGGNQELLLRRLFSRATRA